MKTYKEKIGAITLFFKELGFEKEMTEEISIEFLGKLTKLALDRLSKEFPCDDIKF